MYTVEKRKVTHKVFVRLGWHLGFGYLKGNAKGTREAWCLMLGGRVIAEFRSKKEADRIAYVLNDPSDWN